MVGKKKPYVAPKAVRHETDHKVPSELRSVAQELRDEVMEQLGPPVQADYTTLVDADRRYIEVSDSFCQLVGYRREELIGKRYDDLTAPGTNDIPTVFRLFVKHGYMHGLWMLVHRTGARVLVRYESWVRPDCYIQSKMELVRGGH
jgi:PAS domain-containing protein